ncbi:unnamed protein product [Symbiodinium sp. KB8]|nr:unnamed protein product [Symbiodinium sp. KB8]
MEVVLLRQVQDLSGYDSIAFANGMIGAGMSCQLIHYVHEEHDTFFEVCKNFDAIIVRCNPGQIKADGGDQGKFDDGMRALRKQDIQVWPAPDVMEFMGAKDALCKVATLKIGLEVRAMGFNLWGLIEDTLAYYDPADFATGFKKTMAFQPRVIKQNRGSSGEGIWIIKLKSGKSYGERSCSDDEMLDLMEANDNHSEECLGFAFGRGTSFSSFKCTYAAYRHTVGEFIEFCVSGRTSDMAIQDVDSQKRENFSKDGFMAEYLRLRAYVTLGDGCIPRGDWFRSAQNQGQPVPDNTASPGEEDDEAPPLPPCVFDPGHGSPVHGQTGHWHLGRLNVAALGDGVEETIHGLKARDVYEIHDEPRYLEGGKEAGGQLVDQRFCPRIVEGELRYNMAALLQSRLEPKSRVKVASQEVAATGQTYAEVGDSLVGIIHKKPKMQARNDKPGPADMLQGGISAVGGTGSVYTYYGPNEKRFKNLTNNFLKEDLPKIMPALGLGEEPIPLWWTSDFINSSPEGTEAKDEKWIVGEFNCSCVGKDDTPNACYTDIPKKDLSEVKRISDLLGKKATDILVTEAKKRSKPAEAGQFFSDGPVDVSSLTRVVKDDQGLLPQPRKPRFKTALTGIYVRSQPQLGRAGGGGTDKSFNGHRYDSMAFANGIIQAGMSCQLINYVHQEHDKFFDVVKNFDAIIVRCNPGQIKADGGDQGKFDNGMRAIRKKGIQVWPAPDVMEFMGAKDALCKIATLNIGLEAPASATLLWKSNTLQGIKSR